MVTLFTQASCGAFALAVQMSEINRVGASTGCVAQSGHGLESVPVSFGPLSVMVVPESVGAPVSLPNPVVASFPVPVPPPPESGGPPVSVPLPQPLARTAAGKTNDAHKNARRRWDIRTAMHSARHLRAHAISRKGLFFAAFKNYLPSYGEFPDRLRRVRDRSKRVRPSSRSISIP